ncbi:MAG TPA: hypothetical protein VFY65_20755, partial [Longimicrobium sp.]|nr:hypothetical protein [Longimicrobium sp.]
PLLERVCTGLAADVAPSGGVGRGGQQYLFDTAIALSALLAWRGIGGRLPDPALPHRLFAFIQRLVAERRAVDPRQGGDSDRWSLRFGAHLLKVALAINAYHDHFGVPECRTLVNALTDDLLPLERDGRFVTFAGSRETYTHASCYALEGLLDITRRGLGDHREVIDRGADWLVECQGTSGGLHAWHDGERFQGPIHSDATAQAVRIWLLADPARFRAPVSRALAFLADQQAPAGGIYYRDGSGDVNTWATIFAVQAVQWSAGGDRGALV